MNRPEFSRMQKVKKNFMQYKGIRWILPVLIIVLIGGIIYNLTFSTQKKMEQSASDNVKDTVQLIADNVSEIRENDINGIYNLASALQMNEDIDKVLKQAAEGDNLSWAAAVDADTGLGVTSDGKPFDNRDLHCRETATLGERSVSKNYLNDQGMWAFTVQCPIYEDGALTGALYADISLERYDGILPSKLYNKEGILYMLDENTKRFIYQPLQTGEYLSTRFDLQSFLSEFGVSDTKQEKNILEAINQNKWQILRLEVEKEPSYMFFWPVEGSDWYLCGIVPQMSIQQESLAVGRTIRWISVLIVLAVVLLLCFFYWDIRQKERMEKKQRQYRIALFNGIASSINDVVLMFDCKSGENEIAFENIERVLGVSYKELLNLSAAEDFQKKYAGTALAEVLCTHQFSQGENCREELEWYNPVTKEMQWINVEIIYMDLMGVAKCIVSVFDLTQERVMQDSLKTAVQAAEKANKVKSEFLSHMSHEIRTPMNAALGMIQLSQKYLKEGKNIEEYLIKAEVASKQLLSLISDILDISRIESGKMVLYEEWFSLREMLNSVASTIEFQTVQKNQHFSVCAEDCQGEELYGDSSRLRQILINLLSNAAKYTQTGGSVELIVSSGPDHSEGSREYVFQVIDNGYGMSREFQEKMFAPFEREDSQLVKKENGTGLGLSIVHNFISLMKGDMEARSEVGKGSAFTVRINFPVHTEARVKPPEKGCNCIDLSGVRVLLAEDNELNREIITEFLKQIHIETETAEDGKDAYEKFAESEAGYFDVILMDMQMPVWDGLESTMHIRNLDRQDAKTIPIIAATANAFREDEKKCMAAGMNGYVTKPIDSQKLYKKISELLEERHEM